MSTKVALALDELGFDPENPDVLDAGNLFSIRNLLSAGFAKLEMQRRGAGAARMAALEETSFRDLGEKQRRGEEAFVAALEEQKRRVAESARVAALEEKNRRDLEEKKRHEAKAKAKKGRAAARRATESQTTKERGISVGTPPTAVSGLLGD